jgi:hypothetical protein
VKREIGGVRARLTVLLLLLLMALLATAGEARAAWQPLGSSARDLLINGDGVFDRAWGEDVIQGDPTDFEVCTVASTCKAGTGVSAIGGTVMPRDAAVGPDGNVYVADGTYNRVQVFTADGTFLRGWGKGVNAAQPGAFGVCTAAANCRAGLAGPEGGTLNEPAGIAVDAAGHVLVGETRAARVSEFDANGVFIRLWGRRVNAALPGDGFEICPAADAAQCTEGLAGGGSSGMGGQFDIPEGIAADASGNVYVADYGYHRVQKFNSARQFVYTVGSSVNNNPNAPSHNYCNVAAECKEGGASGVGGGFDRPFDIAVAPDGDFVVGEGVGNRISRFSSAGVFERTWGRGVNGGTTAEVCTVPASCTRGFGGFLGGELYGVGGVAVDAAGRVYASEGNRIQRFDADGGFQLAWGRNVDASAPGVFGVCTTAPNCEIGQSGGLGGELNQPAGLGAAPDGTLFVGDASNQRIVRFLPQTAPPPPPPAAPTVSAVSPASPADENSPKISGTAPAGTTVSLYGNAACSGTALATGSAAAFTSPGLTITVADNSTTTVYATATDAGGTSACSSTFVTYVEDSTLATVRFFAGTVAVPEAIGTVGFIVERSGNTTGQTTVAYASGNDSATAPADFGAVTGTVTFAPGETQQRIEVTYVDDLLDEGNEAMRLTLSQPSAGSALGTPSTIAITITDNDHVETTFTSGPEGYLNDLRFRFFLFVADPLAGTTFECSLDAAAFAACTSPFDPGTPSEGPHTFAVRARLASGAVDPTPATRAFFVDTIRPEAAAAVQGGQLPGGKYSGTVSVAGTGTDAGSGVKEVRCALDPATAPQTASEMTAACPVSTSAAGDHSVYVAALDKAGNAGIPVKVTFAVAPAPDTSITSGPPATTWFKTAAFRFTSPTAGSTFRCRVDAGAFGACTSPFTSAALGVGEHAFEVAAVSPEGVVDPTPARGVWRVNDVAAVTGLDCRVEPVPRDAYWFFGYRGSALGGCEVSSPCPSRWAGRLCMLFQRDDSYGTHKGYSHRRVTTVCPRGARCTLSAQASFFDADHGVNWRAVAEAETFPPEGDDGPADVHDCQTGLSGDRCSASASVTILGRGDVIGIACLAHNPSQDNSDNRPVYGGDSYRRLECDGTLKIEPVDALDTAVNGARVETYAPGAGTVRIAAGASGGRSATTAKRAPAFKAITNTTTSAGPVPFALKLSRSTKRKLRQRGTVSLAARLSFTAQEGGTSVEVSRRLVLRRPAKLPRACGRRKGKRRCVPITRR